MTALNLFDNPPNSLWLLTSEGLEQITFVDTRTSRWAGFNDCYYTDEKQVCRLYLEEVARGLAAGYVFVENPTTLAA